ncbi:hypothetical protein SAMN04487967_2690 [Natronorubrum sediminis]|uniref:DUF7344 domain-containing protein n=1 Tax=Natronorubrum sediminis TaxID=640943 RepID=A0A1H6G3S2_9EURY|nr:transcriptional regulator [Natronorubrum sediminis]SEH16535.1 hypothetical protein SAMN04487967_2690 [Natronorubrum sediminis]
MSSEASSGSDRKWTPLEDIPSEWYDILRNPRRLRLLEELRMHRTRVSLASLTTAIVERESPDVSNGEARYNVRLSLLHNHLPRLADYGIVEWDTESGVELVDDSPLYPADLSRLLEYCRQENGEDLLEAIVHPVRLEIVSLLTEHEQPATLEYIASTLAAHDVGSTDPLQVKRMLHHVHLPTLEAVGLLEFDHDTGVVTQQDQHVQTIR